MPNIKEEIRKDSYKSQESLKKLEKDKTKVHNLQQETDKKVNILNYYNSLSEGDKFIFKQELEKKKVRNSYENYLKYVYGENYVLTKFHKFLAKVCETVVKKIEEGKNIKIALSVPPQHGKLIQNDIPVLTNNGWKKHGDLQIGDLVYNEKGKLVEVTNVFPKDIANCRVTFTNGEEILCHENHEWVVYDRYAHKLVIRETKFIEQCVEENHIVGRGHRYRFQLPLRQPIIGGWNYELKVNPYVLGVWLGDGTNTKPNICACEEDKITLLECEKYYPVGENYEHKITGVLYKSYLGLRKDLQNYGMCYCNKRSEKHIPKEYLTANIDQRLELLAGLLDTDGHLDRKQHRYVFVTCDKKLKDTFEDLINTFGWRTTTYECKPTVSTSGIVGRKITYQIAFNPTLYIPCRIHRKQLHTFSKQRKVSICKVERIKPLEGNCISVQNEIYLVGRKMVPTHNSMTISETLPSWFLGRNPNLRCICAGYNADMAEKFGDRNREKVKKYGKTLFGTEVSESQDNKTLFNIKDHLGGLYSAGITGGLTGNQGALIIIDDPFKNGIEAKNQGTRDNIWQIFCDSILTRQRGKGNAIIVIHTRWHEDDLIGRIIKNDKNGEWLVINIPCVAGDNDRYLHRKKGETLCPELGFDSRWVENMKATIGLANFNALYQGKPFIEGGNIVKAVDIMHYNYNMLPTTFEEYVLSCDLSFGEVKKSSDPYCMTLWGRNGGNHYLLKVYDKKASFTETNRTIRHICGEYPLLKKKLIEKKANGNATIELLGKEIGGFVPFDPKGQSKEDRLSAVSPFFESHNVWFPDKSIEPNIEIYEQQLLKFPNAEHDDFVDTISQYLLNYEYKYGGKVSTDSSLTLWAKAIRGF